ncbi:hypothetical protein AB0K14_21040 [Actinosynnema sp. NPDC050801]|uniref:hypothetical protein n=1 Tax=unclassified Actinosynnema TaxID=2637065 RepID=UPI0033DFB44E
MAVPSLSSLVIHGRETLERVLPDPRQMVAEVHSVGEAVSLSGTSLSGTSLSGTPLSGIAGAADAVGADPGPGVTGG